MKLLYLSPFPFERDPTGVWHPEAKSWTGACAYQAQWPGEVIIASPGHVETVATEASVGNVRDDGTGPSIVEIPPFSEPDSQVEALQGHAPDVVLTLMNIQARHLPSRLPVVFTVEHDFAIRRDMASVSGSSFQKARAMAGLIRREPIYRRMAKQALSLQCNGPAATAAYRPLAPSLLSYMDHRLTRADVALARQEQGWDGTRPLRLGFSGRWTAIKGPLHAVRVAELIQDTLPGVRLAMYGSGELESVLRREAPGNVDFLGFREFDPEWKEEVRRGVDLMVLPHMQGDPSCTYFESLGSGAPVVGYHNDTLAPLVQQWGVGTAVDRGDVEGLAAAVVAIASDPDAYAEMRLRGLELVGAQTWEDLTAERVAHLHSVVRA